MSDLFARSVQAAPRSAGVLALAALVCIAPAHPAAARETASASVGSAAPTAAAADDLGAAVSSAVAGLWVEPLPVDLGEPWSGESTGDDDEQISTTVWESARPEGGHRVDAAVTVIRSDALRAGPAAAFAWLRDWQERPEQEADYVRRSTPGGVPYWYRADQVIWQPADGVVASVRIDPSRFEADLDEVVARSRWGGEAAEH